MKKFNFNPFPILTTERLVLRQVKSSDAHEIFYLRSDEYLNQFISTRKKPETPEAAAAYIIKTNTNIYKGELVYWAICLKGDLKVIGTICLWNLSVEKNTAEIGYELSEEFHKLGIMHEAMEKVIDYGFNIIELDAIDAYTQNNNVASIRLLKKNNFLWDKNRKDEDNEMNHIFRLERSI